MLELSGQRLSLKQIADVASGREHVALSAEARARVEESRRVVEKIVAEGRTVYGVNTGFGKLSDVHIEPSQLRELQLNLVRSHACGLAPPPSDAQPPSTPLLPPHPPARPHTASRSPLPHPLLATPDSPATPPLPETAPPP